MPLFSVLCHMPFLNSITKKKKKKTLLNTYFMQGTLRKRAKNMYKTELLLSTNMTWEVRWYMNNFKATCDKCPKWQQRFHRRARVPSSWLPLRLVRLHRKAFELALSDREDRSRYKWRGGKSILNRSLIKGKKAREYETKLKEQEMKLG